ncbi:MAG: hypothetical protein ACI8W8_000687, partial [Rhodothermales bacterium]
VTPYPFRSLRTLPLALFLVLRRALAHRARRQDFIDAFGAEQGGQIWGALLAAAWLKPQNSGKEGLVLRSSSYGSQHFTGPLEPYADASLVTRIMQILDARVVLVAYGDNANLSTSVAKAIGALHAPAIADNPTAKELRAELNRFLDAQAAGYASLVDEDVQMFSFGRDETTGKFFGWNDDDDNWVVGHQDYLVNEFRDPTMFVVARFDLSETLLRNLGFKIRSYDTADSRCLFTLVPYEGSAFQSFGLDLGMPLMDHPIWRMILENAVDIHLDYAKRNGLPGFLSESYSGEGTDYTGSLGLPDFAVTAVPREVHGPSLYTLGTAYQIASAKVNAFVQSHDAVIRSLYTEHGPWEGYQVERQEAIQFQTTAHTLSLILGALGHGPENMRRYLAAQGLSDRVQQLYHHGKAIDLLGPGMGITPWASDGAAISATREGESVAVRSESAGMAGVAFTMPEGKAQSLAGGVLQIRYQAARAVDNVRIVPKGPNPLPKKVIPIDIQTRFAVTGLEPGLLRIPLPPTASLSDVLKIELNLQGEGPEKPQIFILREFSFTPMPPDSR